MSSSAKTSQEKAQAAKAVAVEAVHRGPRAAGTGEALLALQGSAGNRAVAELLRGSPGKPLDPSTRREMESKFGENFGDVKVHTDVSATASAAVLGAKAWTSGRDIAFGEGSFAPATSKGKNVLAHELAHVVQQRRGGAAPRTFETASPAERDATRAAAQTASPGPVTVSVATGAGVARDEAELPWWKKRLNPIYQKALEVLPKEAAAKLREANATAKELVQQSGVPDEGLNKAVHAAEPVLGPLATALGVKDDAGGGPQPAGDAAPAAAPSQTQAEGSDSGPSATPKSAASTPGKKGVRINYPADPHAFSGLELAYTAEPDESGTRSPGVHKLQHYWLAPQLRGDKVVSYRAYNPEMKRTEYVIGPDQLQFFLAHEKLLWYNAAAAYPIQGELPAYKALSGRVAARALQGDLAGAFKAWKGSWKAAAKDPSFWMEATMATAGAALGAAGQATGEARAAAGGLKSMPGVVADETAVAAPKMNVAGASAEIPKTPPVATPAAPVVEPPPGAPPPAPIPDAVPAAPAPAAPVVEPPPGAPPRVPTPDPVPAAPALAPAARPSSILGGAARRMAGKLRNRVAVAGARVIIGGENAVPAVKMGTGTSFERSALYAGEGTAAGGVAPRAAAPAPPVIESAPAPSVAAPAPAPPVVERAPAPPAPALPVVKPAATSVAAPAVPAPGPAAAAALVPATPIAAPAPVTAPAPPKGMSTGELDEANALKLHRAGGELLGEKTGGYDAHIGGKKILNSEVHQVDKKGNPIIVRDITLTAPDDIISIKTITQLDKYGQPTTKPLPDLVADNVKVAVKKAYNQPVTRARARTPLPGTNIYERTNVAAPKKITIIVQVPGPVTQAMRDAAAKALANDTRLAELPPVEVIVQTKQ